MKKSSVSAFIGAVFGLIVGYPLSYFCQPGGLRAKISLGGYIEHISDVFESKDLRGTAIGAWIGSVIVFAIIGLWLDAKRRGANNTKP